MTLVPAVQNKFIAGLKTEYTGLNFPENAVTSTSNCVFTLIGDVQNRGGINYETNYTRTNINRANSAMASYKWNNVGGDGETQILVQQIGNTLYFYQSSNATTTSPLSTTQLASTITISTFLASGSSQNPALAECQFADGNGYLFVYHPYCDPFYCLFNAGTITSSVINIQIRDFVGVVDPVAVNFRPTTLTNEHEYNLTNQGWTAGAPWTASSATSVNYGIGSVNYTVASGITGVSNGQMVSIVFLDPYGGEQLELLASGTVTGYSGSTLSINITSVSNPSYAGSSYPSFVYPNGTWTISPTSTGYLNTWFADEGNYPSNADVWWEFKDDTNTFNPTVTVPQVTLSTGPAPQGHFILNAFNQQRSIVSAIPNITPVTTLSRPSTGTWFAGRVWYTGVNASQASTGDANFYTWTENIYFSQIVTPGTTTNFGYCYEENDPTSETLFNSLPSDGGVIVIQGSGAINKLFPFQAGILVFADNGIWFISGSSGVGFTATDYSIQKVSAIKSIGATSFIDIQGNPVFWNTEGIYSVTPHMTQSAAALGESHGGLTVTNLCLGTILTFYNSIPFNSKLFARGDYHPLDYIIQWAYCSTDQGTTNLTNVYQYDSILCYNTANQAFYTYSINGTSTVNGNVNYIHDIKYISNPNGGANIEQPIFKYLTSVFETPNYFFTFAEENDFTTYTDFNLYDSTGVVYTSTFTTGYNLRGQALRKFFPVYIYLYSRNVPPTKYIVQSIWDYASDGTAGRQSQPQLIDNTTTTYNGYNFVYRRHKLRGHGMAVQTTITNVPGFPFDIIGWSTLDNTMMSV